MNGFETYKLYHAIALHFTTPSYDYFKYHGKTNVTPNSWYERNDKFFFEKLGNDYNKNQLIGIFVSYFAQEPNHHRPFIKDLLPHSKNGYISWKSKIESLQKVFEDDIHYLKNHADEYNMSFKQLFKKNNGQLPEFLQLLIAEKINFETAIVLNEFTNLFEKLDDRLGDDLIWNEYSGFLRKYASFIKIKKKSYSIILKKVLN